MTDTDTLTRPLIDFSGTSRATAREYAKAANSRVLAPESQTRLRNAAAGGKVDAYDLNEAILDAMRSASTRLGQSMARRDLTRKIAYLGHITQAVLQNHADCLPAYPEGERSRVAFEARQTLSEAERALAHQGEVNQSLTADLTSLRETHRAVVESSQTTAEEDQRRIAGLEIDLANANDRITDVVSDLTTAQAKLSDAERDRDAYAAAVTYVLERLPEEQKHRVLGYIDGVKDATS